MTTEQVFKRSPSSALAVKSLLLLGLAGLLVGLPLWLAGCAGSPRHARMTSPYPHRMVMAVVPPRNESGSTHADPLRIADHLTQRLTLVEGLEVLPVNRVLSAMEALQMPDGPTDQAQALLLRQTLGVDGLVIGSITAWDPYDPPKIGLLVELYMEPIGPDGQPIDVRALAWAAVDEESRPAASPTLGTHDQPVTVSASHYDAADPIVRDALHRYATERGVDPEDEHSYRLYRLSMDLFSEFASHQAVAHLLQAERHRLGGGWAEPRTPPR
jgi:hypothetical protein